MDRCTSLLNVLPKFWTRNQFGQVVTRLRQTGQQMPGNPFSAEELEADILLLG